MSTLNPPRKISKRQEMREDRVVTAYAQTWDYFDKNRKLIYGVIAGLVLVLLAAVAWVFILQNKGVEAQEMLALALPAYEDENYREALDGNGDNMGLIAIADEYGSTDAGNLAKFFAADALFNLGEYDEALEYFQAFDKEENLAGASALAGEAAIYEQREEFDKAGDLYRRAALLFESDLMSPQYLLRAGRAYEMGGELDEAREAYEMIPDRFPEAAEAEGIDFHLARIAAMAAGE